MVTWHNSSDKKNVLNIITAKSESFSFKFCNIRKARKLKVAELNQAKDSLKKPWLATDEANRLSVVWEQFARR